MYILTENKERAKNVIQGLLTMNPGRLEYYWVKDIEPDQLAPSHLTKYLKGRAQGGVPQWNGEPLDGVVVTIINLDEANKTKLVRRYAWCK